MLRTATILVLLLCVTTPALADDWTDVRDEFRAMQADPSWQERRASYLNLLDYDGAEAFEEALAAGLREPNAAVVLESLKILGQLESEPAKAALLESLRTAKGKKAQYLLMALAGQKGESGLDELVGLLQGKEPQLAALAALALGEKAVERSLQPLLDNLAPARWKKDWQVVSAVARAIEKMAWSSWTKPKNPKNTNEIKKPAMPAWFKVEDVIWPLIDRLEVAKGRERGDLIQTLESITKKDYGYNVAAWAAHAKGEEPDAATLKKRIRPPYFFGVPLYGRRIVLVMDTNVLTDGAHPFKQRERLREVCAVPGGRDVPWFKILSIKHLLAAHFTRAIKDMPARGQKFELIFSGPKAKHVFGKLVSSSTGGKKVAVEAIEKARVANGNDVLAVMQAALDIAGKKGSTAWSKGPDQIVCAYSSIPWLAKETDAVVVGSTIGLLARRRLVQIHAIGVHEFAYDMMRLFAHLTGGRYLALLK